MYPAKKTTGHRKDKYKCMFNYTNNCQTWSTGAITLQSQNYYQYCITPASATAVIFQDCTHQGYYQNWYQLASYQTPSGICASQWRVVGTSPEEIAARAAAKVEAEAAASRADLLLMSFLSDDQADQYKKDSRFDLVINGRTYRINKGRSGNVQLIENGKPVAKYCAHPEIWTPDGDTLIAQMLMLQTDEARFLQVANRTAL